MFCSSVAGIPQALTPFTINHLDDVLGAMMDLLIQIANVIEGAFRKIESCIEPPVFIESDHGNVFRFQEESIEAAVVQKCARLTSGLNASIVLLSSGYTQELGALFRMLDEFNEDINFLCQAIRKGEISELHKKYLDDFYQEEFDKPGNALLSTQKRETIPRRKIHAALSKVPEQELNPSDNKEVHRTISQAYSGYVHAASTHVMDMYGGNPPRFCVSGMLGTPRIDEFTINAWDYFYRGLLAIMMVALTFKEHDLLKELYGFRDYVEITSGNTEWEHPEVLVKRSKAKNKSDSG